MRELRSKGTSSKKESLDGVFKKCNAWADPCEPGRNGTANELRRNETSGTATLSIGVEGRRSYVGDGSGQKAVVDTCGFKEGRFGTIERTGRTLKEEVGSHEGEHLFGIVTERRTIR